MITKILWAFILLLIGLLALNNYFSIFPVLIFLEDKTTMLIAGVAIIIASMIIFIQNILLRIHRAF